MEPAVWSSKDASSSKTLVDARDHPLDQLTPAEVSRASAAVRRHAAAAGVPGSLRFNTIMLQEPPKAELLAYQRGAGPSLSGAGASGVADVVRAWISHCCHALQVEGVQPTTTPDDCNLAEHIIMADPRIRQLLASRYAITDPDLVVFDPWSLHGTPEQYKGRRLMQGYLYVRSCKEDNEYAHPLDLCPLVDLNLGKVIHVDMYDEPARLPPTMVNYHRDLAQATTGQEWRADMQPINITQPQGPSFSIEGNLVKWQKWHIRVGFNGREGLVLHQVGWQEAGRLRPVLHRASLSEMTVPYGDPNYPYIRKCAMDCGDYGMGFVANSLQLGCDCLGHIKYFDGVVNNAQVRRGRACREQRAADPQGGVPARGGVGMLWKHTDTRLGHVEVRRNRRLVISMVSTFANYEYGMFWYFYLDGTIQLEMKLTGILSTSVTDLNNRDVPFGIAVAPGVVASNHQHLFCMRIDPAVDDAQGGKGLVVAEVNAERLPFGPDNPHGNAFRVSETPLLSVHQAMRTAKPEAGRAWKIKNPAVVNPITGQPVSFKLIPQTNCPMLMQPDSLAGRRAFFASKHLFVTPHVDGQLFAAGDHVVQSEDCLGLRQWTKEDQPLLGADPVLWYSFGVTHLPRLEDSRSPMRVRFHLVTCLLSMLLWLQVMPVETVGFMMKPYGFFTWNPTLDVPPERNAVSREEVTAAARGAKGVRSRL
ncbi:copper amine oxidase [Scenedesmus sp. NREL 46B-D3]|nr:copper amine oxidase [Scenedesmus sp. NREL 46B-D3]